jgi:peptidoglycan/xylan/chitin deacetylase (PgdA/CDA1 family)
LFERGWPVFTLHKVAPPPTGTRDPFEFVSPAELDEMLGRLLAAGLQPATLSDLCAEPATPRRRFVITFDDGYANVVSNALPVLHRYGVKAVQFLVAGKLGGRNDWDLAKGDTEERLMDEAQVRDWLAAGHAIGSHSLTHANLRKISPAAAREEVSSSRKLLEDRFGVRVEHFCHPYGLHNDAVRELVSAAGYRSACTVEFGVNRSEQDLLELRRIVPLTAAKLFRKIFHRLGRKLRGA